MLNYISSSAMHYIKSTNKILDSIDILNILDVALRRRARGCVFFAAYLRAQRAWLPLATMLFSSTEGSPPKLEVAAGTCVHARDAQLLRECLCVTPAPMRMDSQVRPSTVRPRGVVERDGDWDRVKGEGMGTILVYLGRLCAVFVEEAGGIIQRVRAFARLRAQAHARGELLGSLPWGI